VGEEQIYALVFAGAQLQTGAVRMQVEDLALVQIEGRKSLRTPPPR